MGNRREFDIAFVGLKPGLHEFTYEVDDKFFSSYSGADFTNCKAKIKLSLEKNTSFLMARFEIGGVVDVVCDRCGNPLAMDLWDEFNMVIKLVDNPDEMNATEEDPDIYYISRTESHLHVADWIYEFVSLSIPMQRMCREEEIGGPQCNKEVLAMLKKMESGKIENNNPLLKGLEKFKNKKS
jgi:Predicted metal-binding, possibly nucleic acid-binding protein